MARIYRHSVHDVDLASIARLIGDRTRAAILTALLDGRALTAGELARLSNVSAATASGHLSLLLDAGLVATAAQGRHRYYRLAGPEIAQVLEALATVSAPKPAQSLRTTAAARALKPARLCYDHIAGELGVRIHDHLIAIGGIAAGPDGITITAVGASWFASVGVEATPPRSQRRPPVRQCLDWTERRYHLAGSMPAALATELIANGWLARRAAGQRGLDITAWGAIELDRILPLDGTVVRPAEG
jgi:DNA-binding transcriptional ArsR family regulator